MSITTSQGRTYEINGKQLPSVTTILGILQKPALVPWAAKMTAESFDEQMQEYYQPEECRFVVPDTALPAMLDTAKKAHRAKSKKACYHGTRVHESISFWIDSECYASRGEVREYIDANFGGEEEDIDKAMAGFDAFIEWGDANSLHIIQSEQVVSDDEFYAGRYDLLCKLNGRIVLIDIKTSTGIWDEYWLQCAGYANCLEDLPEAIGVLRIDKETGEIEYVEKADYHHQLEAFTMLALAYHHLQACKPAKKTKGE